MRIDCWCERGRVFEWFSGCVSSSVLSAFVFVRSFKYCVFAYMLYQCFCPRCFSMIGAFQIFKVAKPNTYVQGPWYPISATPSPSSSIVLLRSNRRWSQDSE